MNVTAVAELCDDTFEEHVLEYPASMAGLYLHGINFNLPEFATLSGPEVHEFADNWGFKKAQYVIIQSLDDVKSFLEKCAETGSWGGRDTEGFVIRCKIRETDRKPYRDWFFKYKFEEPYLMYRQWREATKAVIMGKPPQIQETQADHRTVSLLCTKAASQKPQTRKRVQPESWHHCYERWLPGRDRSERVRNHCPGKTWGGRRSRWRGQFERGFGTCGKYWLWQDNRCTSSGQVV